MTVDGRRSVGDLTDVALLADAVRSAYEAACPPDDPMMTLEMPHLIDNAEHAGFTEITAQLTATTAPAQPGDDIAVTTALRGRPNPNLPSATELARSVLTPTDARRFTDALEHAVRQGRGQVRRAYLYLTATVDGSVGVQ